MSTYYRSSMGREMDTVLVEHLIQQKSRKAECLDDADEVIVEEETPEETAQKQINNSDVDDVVDDDDNSEDTDGSEKFDDNNKLVDKEEKKPWSVNYIGIPINYLCVGLVYGGSVNLLYPVLIIQNGVTSSFYSAATSAVILFWSYKVFFGMLCDCVPIRGRRWKWYIVLGWILCSIVLVALALMGEDIKPTHFVIMLTLANLGYVMADVAADGFMVWMAHHENEKRRGKVQTLIYIMREIGRLLIAIVIIFGFSGPLVSCPGYEPDTNIACTTDESITSKNDEYDETSPNNGWCHAVCDAATFSFGMTIPQFVWILAGVNIASIPVYFLLYEEKSQRKKARDVLNTFWKVLTKKAVWMLVLYTMVSSITFNVYVAAKNNANFVWLDFTNAQNALQSIFENIVFLLGLSIIRRYGLAWSWRKMMWAGTLLVACFNLLYLLIVFDVVRNSWFYMFTDVTDNFMSVLNFLAASFAIVEVSEPGFEAITYALITTASNATIPLSSVISYQFMAFFPELNTQAGIAADTPNVRRDMALLILLVEIVNVTSLFSLPMLVRQKKEAQEMVEAGGESKFWARFTVVSVLVFLIYSTLVTFLTIAGADTYGCLKILGGAGCSDDESSVPVYCLVGAVLVYCYSVNFYHTFLPILRGERKFSVGMFF